MQKPEFEFYDLNGSIDYYFAGLKRWTSGLSQMGCSSTWNSGKSWPLASFVKRHYGRFSRVKT